MKKKIEGYLTVEASLVISIVIGVVLLVVYLLFFQYDRCLMEHNTGLLGIRGCSLQVADKERLCAELAEYGRQEDKRYLAWDMSDIVIKLKNNCVFVERDGRLRFPFKSLMSGYGDSEWGSSVSFENHWMEPVKFIRICRKLSGGK